MFLTLSLMLTPIILIGVIMTGVDLFQFLSKHTPLGIDNTRKAGMTVFFVLVLSAGLMVAPHRIAAPLGYFSYAITAAYIWYLAVGARYCWKWLWMIKRTEDSDPTNDLKEPGDCGRDPLGRDRSDSDSSNRGQSDNSGGK